MKNIRLLVLTALLLFASLVHAGTVVNVMFVPGGFTALDTFTESNGTQLSAHTPDTANFTWSSGDNTKWTISGNAAVGNPGATNVYTSDFSAGTDDWSATQGTAGGNVDGIDGQDDNLRLTVDSTNNVHYIQRSGLVSGGKTYRIRFDYYIPSGQSNIDGLKVSNGNVAIDGASIETTTDSWTNVDLYFTAGASSYIRFAAYDGVSDTFQDAGGDDVFYIRNVIIDQITENERFCTADMGITSGVFDVDLTMTELTSGLCLLLNSVSSPTYWLECFYNKDTGKVELWKYLNSVGTQLLNVTATYGAGNTLRVTLTKSGANTLVDVKYNGNTIGTQQTLTDSTLVAGTRHGLMSTSSSNSLDNFEVNP